MVTLERLGAMAGEGRIDQCLLPPDAGLRHWPVVPLDEVDAGRFGHGNPVDGVAAPAGPVRVYGPGDILLGLGEVGAGSTLRARRVMNLGPVDSAQRPD
jgi:hypothetical protein